MKSELDKTRIELAECQEEIKRLKTQVPAIAGTVTVRPAGWLPDDAPDLSTWNTADLKGEQRNIEEKMQKYEEEIETLKERVRQVRQTQADWQEVMIMIRQELGRRKYGDPAERE